MTQAVVSVMKMHAAVGRMNLVSKWFSYGKLASLKPTTEKLSRAHMCTGQPQYPCFALTQPCCVKNTAA